MYDFIIVGQGIAGSMLAWFIHKAGKKILVIDELNPNSATAVAGGITNPVTGRRLVKTWLADDIIPFAENTYCELEEALNSKFYERLKIVRLFDSVKSQNDWSARCALPEYSPYLDNQTLVALDETKISNPFGAFEINGGSRLDTRKFLSSFRSFLSKQNMLLSERFEIDELKVKSDSVVYRNAEARQIIFCEGINGAQNPFFKGLRFHPSKGECLIVEIKDLEIDFMLKSDVLLLPFFEKNIYYIGATHENNFADALPSKHGKAELVNGLNALLKCSYKILEHWSAVRPAVSGRRPLIGVHPEIKTIAVFNGLGTKGVSLAAYFANHFTQHLLGNTSLMAEVDINRFLS